MREIIFIGNKDELPKFRDFVFNLLKLIIDIFELKGKIIGATDSFFITDYSKYKTMQVIGHSKYEVQVLIPETGNDIAVSSYNDHQQYFSKRFNIRINNELAYTACVGFGLERIIYAIFAQHELNLEKIQIMLERFKKYANDLK